MALWMIQNVAGRPLHSWAEVVANSSKLRTAAALRYWRSFDKLTMTKGERTV